ncbi:hypothetical protein QP794_01755 [Paenibacillus sp. UMB7766-LJ446]|uniref:hypothetical protein n=1 Tax=Paenibacillus sp. UMB7766-LJ446 TaxID=3046313 RepID=UPI002550F7E7|nr:hypothetical protein [Paenibacillus sp. UMB7766-LJ446]MDK8188807.1 hypothetical protein [Paenibacillus sp. UMB7766-LJ446]
MSEKLANYINSISPAASQSVKDKLEDIEFKDQFREPERADIAWLDVARLLQSIPVHELAAIIKSKAVEVSFTDEELQEISRALFKNVANIERAIESKKITEKDRSDIKEWKQHNASAQDKIKDHFGY